MTLFLFGLFFVLLLLELPVAFAIGVSSSVAVLLSERLPPTFIVSKIFAGLDSFPLMAIPFYVLAGNLMSEGGLTQKIVSFANALVGHVRGGLAHVSIVSAAIFSGVSGSAAADTAAIGSIMIPAMKKEGYAADFSVCVVASACTMGPIIPPSILFIVYGSLVQVSVGQLFLAGFLPGLVMMVTLMAFAAVIVRTRGYAASHARFLVRRAARTLTGAGWALLVPVIIIGGIVGGWFTPTEAGVIAVVYALLVSMLVLRTVRIVDVPRIFVESAMMTAIVMLILGPATVFGSLLIRDHFPDRILAALGALTSDPTASVFLMLGFIIAAGFVIDVMVLIIMLAYPFAQIAAHYGYDPIHFGVIFILAATIGGITPPVGSLLFVACSIGRIGLTEASRAIWPFVRRAGPGERAAGRVPGADHDRAAAVLRLTRAGAPAQRNGTSTSMLKAVRVPGRSWVLVSRVSAFNARFRVFASSSSVWTYSHTVSRSTKPSGPTRVQGRTDITRVNGSGSRCSGSRFSTRKWKTSSSSRCIGSKCVRL